MPCPPLGGNRPRGPWPKILTLDSTVILILSYLAPKA